MKPQDRGKFYENQQALREKTRWSEELESQLEMDIFPHGYFKRFDDPVTCLYQKIQKRGPKAYERLGEILQRTDNGAAARILDPSLGSSELDGDPNSDRELRSGQGNQVPAGIKCYTMVANPRGCCLIINIMNVTSMKPRRGSEQDVENLRSLFEYLQFKVIVKDNLNGDQFLRELDAFSQLEDHKSADMCVVVVASHGNDDHIISTDNQPIRTEHIVAKFNNQMCPNLRGKPKFFIFQACRGSEFDYGYEPIPSTQGVNETDSIPISPHLSRIYDDVVIAFATIPGYVASRNTSFGSWYIHTLCKVFKKRAIDTEIRDMLDEVSRDLKSIHTLTPMSQERKHYQGSTYEVRGLDKKLFFYSGRG